MTKITLIFTVIVFLGLCSLTAFANTKLSQPQEIQLFYNVFKEWTSKHNRQYGIEEMVVRFLNWKENYDFVQEHNAMNTDSKLEMNDFSDLNSEEFSALHMGLSSDFNTPKNLKSKGGDSFSDDIDEGDEMVDDDYSGDEIIDDDYSDDLNSSDKVDNNSTTTEVDKNTTNNATKNATDNSTNNTIRNATDNATSNSTNNATSNATKNSTQNTTNNTTNNTNNNASKNSTSNATNNSTTNKTNNATKNSTKNTTKNTTNNKKKSNTNRKRLPNKPKYGLPKSVDWRKAGAVTSVKNQATCGGCYSFATAGALEGLRAIRSKSKKLESLSVQQVVDCSQQYGNNGCDGGLMTNSFQYTRDFGLHLESDYGYTSDASYCQYSYEKPVFKNTGYVEVPSNNFTALKIAVSRQPVTVGIEAANKAVQLFKNGVISTSCTTKLDHAVLVVGYDTTPAGQEYWIVKNSWGAKWGLDGYFNIAIGDQNNGAGVCGINMLASYPTLNNGYF